MSELLPTQQTGYAIHRENRREMETVGEDPRMMLRAVQAQIPSTNIVFHPSSLFTPLNQGNQGSCQGHSLALAFTVCYWLSTGRIEWFSRAAAYYWSQRIDGIRGDRGSTLSAGMKVARQGLPLERDWPYPSRYNPNEPTGIQSKRAFKLVASKPTRDFGVIREALDMGLPVQDGVIWDDSVSRTLSTNFVGRGGGGHSTLLWTKDQNGNYRRINSWGMWDRDGCNENTPQSLQQQVQHRFSSHVIYAPEGMVYPNLSPIQFPS